MDTDPVGGGETLAQLIRSVMDQNPGLTQTEIAKRAGVSTSAVNTWVLGTRGVGGKSGRGPSRKSLEGLADALGVARDRVFAAANQRTPGPLSPDAEARILELYRRLSAEEQRIVERQMMALAADDAQA